MGLSQYKAFGRCLGFPGLPGTYPSERTRGSSSLASLESRERGNRMNEIKGVMEDTLCGVSGRSQAPSE